MKVGIFYLAYSPAEDRQPLAVPGCERPVYIRVEVIEARSEGAALDEAQARAGEHVMNTHMVKG